MLNDVGLIESEFDRLSFSYQRVSIKKEVFQIVDKWKRTFCSIEIDGQVGINSGSDFDFELVHVDFSTGGVIRKFEDIRRNHNDFFIRLQYSKNGNTIWLCNGIIPSTDQLKKSTRNIDTFLFPSDYSWNYTLTHEGGYVNDPFFTRG